LVLGVTVALFVFGYAYQPPWLSEGRRDVIQFAFAALFGFVSAATVERIRSFRRQPARRALIRSLVLQMERSATGRPTALHRGGVSSEVLRQFLDEGREALQEVVADLKALRRLLIPVSWPDSEQRARELAELSSEQIIQRVVADPSGVIKRADMEGQADVRAKALRRLVDVILPLVAAPESDIQLSRVASQLEDTVFELETHREQFVSEVVSASQAAALVRPAALRWIRHALRNLAKPNAFAPSLSHEARERARDLNALLYPLAGECICAERALELLQELEQLLADEIMVATGWHDHDMEQRGPRSD
jgi:hypothetical protein